MTKLLIVLLFALQGPVWAQTDLGQQDDQDLGPYTLPFCDIGSCQDGCIAGDGDLTYVLDPKDQFPDVTLTMSADELQRYQSLQQEYIVHFSENPMSYESTIDLPNCGLRNSLENKVMKRDGSFQRWKQEITTYRQNTDSSKPACIPTNITAKISFNVVTSNYSTNYLVTNDIITAQFNKIVNAYRPLGINFEQGITIRWSQPEWRNIAQSVTSQTVDDLKSVIGGIRRGGFDQINVFIVERVEEAQCSGSNLIRTDGFCTYPDAKNPQSDGCFIDVDSMPGIAWRGNTEGDGSTLVHEIGHWFGLRHVYDSNATTQGCHAPDSTYVDTPAYAGPGSADSNQPQCCVDNTGNYSICDGATEHVTNWMSYSEDRGIVDSATAAFPWTRGQRAAMFANFYHFRRNSSEITCDSGEPMYPESASRRGRFFSKHDGITGLAAEMLAQPIHLLDTLKTLCSSSYNGTNALVDSVTGLVDGSQDEEDDGPPVEVISKWNRLGAWRWVIIGIAVMAFLAVGVVGGSCLLRRMKEEEEYAPVEGQGHELQKRGLKDMVIVQARTVEPSSEPLRGTLPDHEDVP